jgi:FlaG/FlaF family flagellin (archaellin)
MSERSPDSGVRRAVATRVGVARDRLDGGWIAILLLGAIAAVVSVVVATRLFPYHSLNHDEGVYLQQAELLRAGRLFLRPPVDGPYRPWFFVDGPQGLYSKYSPVTPAVFALGRMLGAYPIALAGISATVVAGTATVGRELFDARVGVLAGVLLLASPLFLLHSGTYLPYAGTAAFEVVFAYAYLRAERTGSRRLATLAGLAIGVAFFARPYTAVLFAAPFIVHACASLARSGAWRAPFARIGDDERAMVARRLATAGLGVVGVAVTLGYNAVVTGDPLVFPFLAFAPEDGVGFGHRELLGHEVQYTPELALEANGRVLATLFTDWVAMGVVGTALAAAGVAAAVVVARRRGLTALSWRRGALAGMFLTIPAGNVAFWGNFNVLGRLDVATDGLIYHLGPYYHYDLLIPTAIFGAVAAVWGLDRLHAFLHSRLSPDVPADRIVVAAMVVAAGVGGVVAVDTASGPIERNAAVSEELAAAYAPFEEQGGLSAGNAVLDGNQPAEPTLTFLPTAYGPWLNHPFQVVRNDPDFDGRSLYVLGDIRELDVAAAHPNHSLRRYVYRGVWNPVDGEPVTAELRPVQRVSGESVRLDAAVGVPAGAESVSIRAGGDAGQTYTAANASEGTLNLSLVVGDGEARLSGPRLSDTGTFAVADRDEIRITVFVSTGPSSGFSYELVFPVETDENGVRALSPTRERCPVPDRCVPAGLGPSPPGTFANTTLLGESGE